ncbi:hypothetical protein AVEN_208815-1, partial [Araneus ventricosus]
RGGLVVRFRHWGGGFQVRNPNPLKIRRVWGLLHVISYLVVKSSPVGVAWKCGEPAQVPCSSSDRGSKVRGPSQNSPRVASKRNVNKTKLLTFSGVIPAAMLCC